MIRQCAATMLVVGYNLYMLKCQSKTGECYCNVKSDKEP